MVNRMLILYYSIHRSFCSMDNELEDFSFEEFFQRFLKKYFDIFTLRSMLIQDIFL